MHSTRPTHHPRYCLSIDQGTHATRALIIDDTGQVHQACSQDITLNRIDHEHVEQDPQEILSSVERVVHQATADYEVDCVALATQRSTIVAWDDRGPLAPALSWQDTRAASLLEKVNHEYLTQTTGLVSSPHYAATKIRWLIDHNPKVQRAYRTGDLTIAPLAAFLLDRLSDRHADHPTIDHTNAARTTLFNIYNRDWDPQLLEAFDIPHDALPDCMSVHEDHGRLKHNHAPITAVCGDQTAALHAAGTPRSDTAYINLGTGAFILVPTGDTPTRIDNLLCTLANSTNTHAAYCIEGTVNAAGAAFTWAEQHWQRHNLTQHLHGWPSQPTNQPIFLNTIAGLGSPYWCQGPPPTLFAADGTPIDKQPNQPDATIAIAIAESILFLLNANLTLIRQHTPTLKHIQISGGLANPNPLCQHLADLTNLIVHRPSQTEATAQGAAYLALNCPPTWPTLTQANTFHPQPNPQLTTRYHRFVELLK